jgi:hypothetical protein
MTEILDAHKTDSQKSWPIRDRKLREVKKKRKLKSPTSAQAGSLASLVFQPLALAISPQYRASSCRFPQR